MPINGLPNSLALGHQMESGVTVFEFDISPWLAKWSGLVCSITHGDAQGSNAYPVTGVVQDGSTLTWTVGQDVTQNAGGGTLVVHGTVDDKRVCSARTGTYVAAGHAPVGDPPDVIADYVAEMAAYANQAKEAATLLQGVSLFVNIEGGTLELWADGLSPIDIALNGNNLEVYKA